MRRLLSLALMSSMAASRLRESEAAAAIAASLRATPMIFALLSAVPPYLEATTGYTAVNEEYSPLAQAAGRFLLQLWYYGDNAETDKLQRVIDSLLKALSAERAQA